MFLVGGGKGRGPFTVRCLIRSLPMRLERVPLFDGLSDLKWGAGGTQWAHAGT